jgi:biopolymer transport protein TolQ
MNMDVRVIGLSVQALSANDVTRQASQLDALQVGVRGGTAFAALRVQSVPTTYVIAKSGKIVLSHVGVVGKRELAAALEEARRDELMWSSQRETRMLASDLLCVVPRALRRKIDTCPRRVQKHFFGGSAHDAPSDSRICPPRGERFGKALDPRTHPQCLAVMLVLAVLASMSLVCWFIGAKLVRLGQASRRVRHSSTVLDPQLGNVWSVQRMERLYATLPDDVRPSRHCSTRAMSSSRACSVAGKGLVVAATMDSARRAMRASYQREIDAVEANLAGLATVGSVSPYIGLFGTVWGIMNAFRGLQSVSQATLAQVAPGIAEALIATAIGLAAAIPAVMAYSFFIRKINVLSSEMDNFSSDYLNIVRRHFLAG